MANKLPDSGPISMLDVYNVLNPPMDPKDCDYYFETREDFDNRIRSVLIEVNYDMSQKTFGFGDRVIDLSYAFDSNILQEHSEFTSTPKMIVARNATNFSELFANCYELRIISKDLFKHCPNATDFSGIFRQCSLDSIPEGLFDYCHKAESFTDMLFHGSSKYIPSNLFDKCKKIKDIGSCFYSGFVEPIVINSNAPDLWNIKKFPYIYYEDYCFYEFSFLNDKEIPVTFGGTYIPEKPSFFNEVDYYFDTLFDFSVEIDKILAENNNDLSQKTLGFGDLVRRLWEYNSDGKHGFFQDDFPTCFKKIYGNNIISVENCFKNNKLITNVPKDLFDNCPNIIFANGCFNECSNITSQIPDLWNKQKFSKVEESLGYAQGCTSASNYNEIPLDFGGPSTNPPVTLSENTINNTKSLVNSIIRTVNIPTSPISLNDKDFRELAGISSGQISLRDFYGKSNDSYIMTKGYKKEGSFFNPQYYYGYYQDKCGSLNKNIFNNDKIVAIYSGDTYDEVVLSFENNLNHKNQVIIYRSDDDIIIFKYTEGEKPGYERLMGDSKNYEDTQSFSHYKDQEKLQFTLEELKLPKYNYLIIPDNINNKYGYISNGYHNKGCMSNVIRPYRAIYNFYYDENIKKFIMNCNFYSLPNEQKPNYFTLEYQNINVKLNNINNDYKIYESDEYNGINFLKENLKKEIIIKLIPDTGIDLQNLNP